MKNFSRQRDILCVTNLNAVEEDPDGRNVQTWLADWIG
jgi:hypothetical protein